MRLIKTALELRKISTAGQNIFLGSWCVKDASALLRLKQKYKVLPYHWDDREKFNADYLYLTSLYEANLTRFTTILNHTHQLNRSSDYWRIIIGPWLRFCGDALFDRYECIKTAAKARDARTYEIGDYDLNDWCADDFPEFFSDLLSDEWNEVIFSECMIFQNFSTKQEKDFKIKPNRVSKTLGWQEYIKGIIKKLQFKFFKITQKHEPGIIFAGAYMPITNFIRLNLKLRQVPCNNSGMIVCRNATIDHKLRSKITTSEDKAGFEGFLSHMLPKLMPAIYLESFLEVREAALNLTVGIPKSVYTSVSYQSDDFFKIWVAEQKEIGTRLIIGQHGGHFGIGKHNQTVDHQMLVATDFVSWGWKYKGQSNVTKLPSLKLADAVTLKPVKDGDILYIMTNLPRYFYCHYSFPVAGQFVSYLEQQIKFFGELDSRYLKHLRIKLDSSFANKGWDLEKLIRVEGYSECIDQSKKNLWSLIKKSRLCVCTHNATVFLETLSRNFPTIIFWDKKTNEINAEAQPFLDLLVDAKILFYSPHEAAAQVNCIADDVGDWWLSDKVQLARRLFCENYVVTSIDWQEEWANFLLNTERSDQTF